MKNKEHFSVCCKRIGKIISTTILLSIAVVIFEVNFGVKNVIALGGQSGVWSSDASYSVDDIRDMYGCERKFGSDKKKELLNEARHQKLESDQIKYIEGVLGDEYHLESANLTAKVNFINSCLDGLTTAMSNGYSANVVLDYYDKVLEAIDAYEVAAEGKWDATKEYTNENAFALIEKIRAFELGVENDKEAATVLGSLMTPVVEWGILETPFERSEDGTVTFRNESFKVDRVCAMLNGAVTRVVKTGQNVDGSLSIAITVNTNESLQTVYYVGRTELKEGDIIKQGDVVGEVEMMQSCKIMLKLDGENRDPLVLFGHLGAEYKKVFMQRNPWITLDLSNIKECPSIEEEKEIDENSVYSTFVE